MLGPLPPWRPDAAAWLCPTCFPQRRPDRARAPPHAGNSTGGQGLSLADLGAAMDQSAPLCMRNLFVHLKEEHHLRHNGRMQLGLFLKGVGLSLEDALLFWRTEFCRKITPEQFEKQYSYNVRHNYGKEGKRQDYTPYSCMKARARGGTRESPRAQGCSRPLLAWVAS